VAQGIAKRVIAERTARQLDVVRNCELHDLAEQMISP
jgi:hypothetical protein